MPKYPFQRNAFTEAVELVDAVQALHGRLRSSELRMTGGAGTIHYGIKVRTPQRIAGLRRSIAEVRETLAQFK